MSEVPTELIQRWNPEDRPGLEDQEDQGGLYAGHFQLELT